VFEMTNQAKKAAFGAMEDFWNKAQQELFPRGCVPRIISAIGAWKRAAEAVESAAVSAQNYFEYRAPR
jgi:hypothetical protein